MNKAFGFMMTGVSTILFLVLASGEFQQPLFGFIPAMALGITGLKLVLRESRYRAPEPQVSDTTDRLQRIERAISSLVIDLDATQNGVRRLTEERAFLEKLLVERKQSVPQQITEHV
jgi:hypothetical protein